MTTEDLARIIQVNLALSSAAMTMLAIMLDDSICAVEGEILHNACENIEAAMAELKKLLPKEK